DVEVEGAVGGSVVERVGQGDQPRRDVRPVLQRLLQGRRDAGGAHRLRQVARDDDERAVAAAFLQGTKFHRDSAGRVAGNRFNCNFLRAWIASWVGGCLPRRPWISRCRGRSPGYGSSPWNPPARQVSTRVSR